MIKTRNVKPQRNMGMVMEGPKVEKKVYPTISFSLKDLPEAKDWEVGEMYQLELTVKQVSKSESDNKDSWENRVTFEVRKIGIDDDEEKDLEEYEEGEEDEDEEE